MPKLAVYTAVKNRLAAQWSATPVVDYDTVGQVPQDDAFLVYQFPVVNEERPTLGRKFWEEGAIRFVLNVKRGVGVEQALTWIDQLATIFRAVKFNGVETFEASGPIIDDDIEDGNIIEYALIVPYRYQFEG